MPSGALWRVLGLCLLSVGAWGQEDSDNTDNDAQLQYEVSISRSTVTVTCYLNPEEPIEWKKDNKVIPNENNRELIIESFSELEDSGYYTCAKSSSEKVYLYLKARVCENCMEVNLTAVVTVIIVDICITLGLLVPVYYWSKNRKAKAKPVKRGTGAGGRPRGQKERPPPVPNPDYEPIRKGQRDLYSGLNQRGV
ncbi:T-cell surface glycoprotein CD3 epsilon chain isoform X1 [Cavia porcellus]|uniref:T-cell surface glycoprotein CD3 epsilon chain n=1 Tax=Cavia porcellus TaxID=10141 RepID=H0UW68_CAVPO|nr:T-cell surface glycoprotein CD3 epsilon chain isoform X2 [Cavia porcellus]